MREAQASSEKKLEEQIEKAEKEHSGHMKELKQQLGMQKGENKFIHDRLSALQKHVEGYIDSSPQVYLKEI